MQPFVSFVTRFVASLAKTRKRPFAEIVGSMLPPSAFGVTQIVRCVVASKRKMRFLTIERPGTRFVARLS